MKIHKINNFKILITTFLCVVLFSCDFYKNKQSRKIEDFYIDTKELENMDQDLVFDIVIHRSIFLTLLIAIDTVECNIYPRLFEKFSDKDIIENLSNVNGVTLNGNDTTIIYNSDDLAYFIFLINHYKGEPISDFAGEILGRKFTEEIGNLNVAIGPPLYDGKNMLLYIPYHLMRKEEDGSFIHENVFIVYHIQDIASPHGIFTKIPIVADWINEWFSVE